MYKQYLTKENNFRNFMKDKKDDEENFERSFSLIFRPNDFFIDISFFELNNEDLTRK